MGYKEWGSSPIGEKIGLQAPCNVLQGYKGKARVGYREKKKGPNNMGPGLQQYKNELRVPYRGERASTSACPYTPCPSCSACMVTERRDYKHCSHLSAGWCSDCLQALVEAVGRIQASICAACDDEPKNPACDVDDGSGGCSVERQMKYRRLRI